MACMRRRCCVNKSFRLKSLYTGWSMPGEGGHMSHRQKPSWMCFVLMWRFHSFFDVNAEPQLYWAKTHGNGLELLTDVLMSDCRGIGASGSTAFTSWPFASSCFASSVFISI